MWKESDFLLIHRTSENGEVTVNMFAFHGCEGDLAAAMDAQVSVQVQYTWFPASFKPWLFICIQTLLT